MVVLRALRAELRRNRARGRVPSGPRYAAAARNEASRDTSHDPGEDGVGALGCSGAIEARAPTSKDRAEGYTRALGFVLFFSIFWYMVVVFRAGRKTTKNRKIELHNGWTHLFAHGRLEHRKPQKPSAQDTWGRGRGEERVGEGFMNRHPRLGDAKR